MEEFFLHTFAIGKLSTKKIYTNNYFVLTKKF